ncbi:MAG: hypothetical protein J7J22_04790 [Candidatus Verstraetearchaeota archaeon]|nr:hypothetical protein [Candidatus Verstraetearchaeota archaeon]
MAFLVGSKGIGTPTWGHSLKIDPYLWSSKLSFLYDINYLRYIESLYGNEVLKQYILEKLKAIDKFDDCLVITDFTQFVESGIAHSLPGDGDNVTWEKKTDKLICVISTDATPGTRYTMMYTWFSGGISKLFISCIFVSGVSSSYLGVKNSQDNSYLIHMHIPSTTEDFRLEKAIEASRTTLATEAVDLVVGASYKVAGYFDVSEHIQKVWRGSDPIDLANPALSATDTDVTAITEWSFMVSTDNTSTTEDYLWRVPLIVAWKA